MCHGPNILNLFRRVASYADRFGALQRQAPAVAEGYPMTAHVLVKRPLPAAKRRFSRWSHRLLAASGWQPPELTGNIHRSLKLVLLRRLGAIVNASGTDYEACG